jgi:hypothetical protein
MQGMFAKSSPAQSVQTTGLSRLAMSTDEFTLEFRVRFICFVSKYLFEFLKILFAFLL